MFIFCVFLSQNFTCYSNAANEQSSAATKSKANQPYYEDVLPISIKLFCKFRLVVMVLHTMQTYKES